MSKTALKYVCQECGTWHAKWVGKCDGCHAWNRLTEETITLPKSLKKQANLGIELVQLDAHLPPVQRDLTGIGEFDRVCGGGLVPGSILLVGGDPGIGKSTLLLQVVAQFSQEKACVYVSGEEAIVQLQMRAQRLCVVHHKNLQLSAATNIHDILYTLKAQKPQLLIIDSIQTMSHPEIAAAPGSISQVKACTHELMQYAKTEGVTVILVGHVTKDGALAGPRVLEHMVDAVLHFEGERHLHYRILRAIKNRFGATDEIGVFEMGEKGLTEVSNPSALFLNHHPQPVSGSAILAAIEGTRPLLVEIQALVAPSHYASPKRTSVGWDSNRLSMILAVLESRCGMNFGQKDVYLNVAGGLRINEPAADLAAAAAIISAATQLPLPEQSVFFGEIGLSGEVRAVSQQDARLKEAEKLGFQHAYCIYKQRGASKKHTLNLIDVIYLIELLDIFATKSHTGKR